MYAKRTISALAAALSIGVCVFITYISRDVDPGTLLFNLLFLGVMLLMLAGAYLILMRRLMQTGRGLLRAAESIRNNALSGDPELLSNALTNDPDTTLFENRFLDDCYAQYRYMASRNPDGSCDIRDFINEDVIDEYIHRGILELIPDILTSLGILGTFIGLVMGLRGFDPSGYEQMAGSITPLINGIKVAFITSIYGISLSLAFSFHLRSEFGSLSALTDAFLDTYYLHVQPPHEVDSTSKLLAQQKSREELMQELTGQFTQQMVKSFEQSITPALAQMSDNISHAVRMMADSQEEVLTRACETAVRQMRTELEDQFKQVSDAVALTAKSQSDCSDFMERSMMNLQQTFHDLQSHMLDTDKYYARSLGELSRAQQDAYRISQEQQATYQEYIRFMYQTLESFSEVWEKNSEKLQGYSDEIAKMGPVQSNLEIRSDLSRIASTLQEVQRHQRAAELDDNNDETAELLGRALRKLEMIEASLDTPRFFRGKKKKESR